MIALLCSVPLEAEALLASMHQHASRTVGSKTCYVGTVNNREIALCAGGMGKANAAHAATILITHYNPEALIIFGIGGAYPSSGARIGDIAVATEEIAGDEGVITAEGFRDTEFIGIPLVRSARGPLYNRFPASSLLLKSAVKALASAAFEGNSHRGKFLTLSACTGTGSRARELETRCGALCENMEGAAAAQVAELHGVPWIEVRGISNMVEERNVERWDIPKAARIVQIAVRHILGAWEQ